MSLIKYIFSKDIESIIFSPHCDDAFLSLGGSIICNKINNVRIINVFSLTNYMLSKNTMSIAKVTSLRKNENYEVFKTLNINNIYLDFPDACIRSPYHNNDNDIQNLKNNPKNDDIYNVTLKNIREIIRNSKNYIFLFFPLGLGNHIDHRMLFEIGNKITKKYNNNILPFFYEDVGYDITENNDAVVSYVRKKSKKFVPLDIKLYNLNDKIKHLKLYRSQVNSEIISLVIRTFNSRKGERVWVKL